MNYKLLVTVFLLALSECVFSQKLSMKIGTNPNLINSSAALEVENTTKGFLLPRMTKAQIKDINSPAIGLMIWCTNCGKTGELQMFNGTVWTNYVASTTESIVTATVPTSTGGKLIFMAHNLGADTSADPLLPSWKLNGAYIQWGKRGPTGNWSNAANAGPIGFAAAPTGNTIATANNSAIPSWIADSTYPANNSWNVTENTPVKTANDPCPIGFRIPTRNEWVSIYSTTPINTQTNWSNVNASIWFEEPTNYSSGKIVSSSLYLPAAGFRDIIDGRLVYRGLAGCYWSSTAVDAYNNYTVFLHSTGVLPDFSNNKTWAYSVRCVSE